VIEALEPGRAVVTMKDRRRVRNHLHSIHAVALMNMGEAASGLAVVSRIPANARAIITHLEIDFLKKARGTLTAVGEFKENLPSPLVKTSFEVQAIITNAAGEAVAKVTAHWLVDGPPA